MCSIALFQHDDESSSSSASIGNVNDHEMMNVVNDLSLWNANKDNKSVLMTVLLFLIKNNKLLMTIITIKV